LPSTQSIHSDHRPAESARPNAFL